MNNVIIDTKLIDNNIYIRLNDLISFVQIAIKDGQSLGLDIKLPTQILEELINQSNEVYKQIDKILNDKNNYGSI